MKIAHVHFQGDEMYGPVQIIEYVDGSPALRIGSQIVSVNLAAYGLVPPAGHVYIKDWSENEGLVDVLVDADVVIVIQKIEVGQFRSRAFLVKVVTGSGEMPVEPDETKIITADQMIVDGKYV